MLHNLLALAAIEVAKKNIIMGDNDTAIIELRIAIAAIKNDKEELQSIYREAGLIKEGESVHEAFLRVVGEKKTKDVDPSNN